MTQSKNNTKQQQQQQQQYKIGIQIKLKISMHRPTIREPLLLISAHCRYAIRPI